MTQLEKFTVQIGELIATDIKDVCSVEYKRDNKELSSFVFVLKCGERYTVTLSKPSKV